MLKLENVSKFYYNKGLIASGFTKVNLELNLGEFVVITGESGSGKSTLLNVISGLDTYEEGEMYINGNETSHYTEKDFEDYRRKYIANIFQNYNLINSYTVYQNIELVLLLNGHKKGKVKKKILEIIDKVGLKKFKNTKVSKLSGGQKQRVAIARAIVKDTPIIVADEPTGNLDSESANEVIELLKNIAKDKLVVIVTHNIEQVEKYATRVLKMHDGRLIENNEIKKVNSDIIVEEKKNNSITIINKIRIGIRNTFNIKTKFILLFMVFGFISIALVAEYGAFMSAEEEYDKVGYSFTFRDLSENRIIINKKNRESFSDEDYAQIKKIENVDHIIEDDVFLDTYLNFQSDEMFGFSGRLKSITENNVKASIGRTPENENEILISLTEKNEYINNMLKERINSEFKVMDPYTGNPTPLEKFVLVGIEYREDTDYTRSYDLFMYLNPEALAKLRSVVNRSNSELKILFNDKYESFPIYPTENVPEGSVFVNDNLKYNFKNYRIIGKPLTIETKNIYYEDSIELNVAKTFTEYNFKRITGADKYMMYSSSIFVNPNDLDSLFEKPSYQSSIFVKDINEIDDTIAKLENLGFKGKKVTDYKINDTGESAQMIKIAKTVVTIVLIVALLFISYFIVKIILKSRNIYYTTLRILGATYKNLKRILGVELFLNSTLAYGVVLSLTYLIKNNIIENKDLLKIVSYLGVREFLIIYIIIFMISLIITIEFSRKIFKNSTITTYNEEV